MEITTAARRITRTINATNRQVKVLFDADGHAVDRHPADMWYGTPADQPDHVIAFPGGRITQREAQAWLNAAARTADRDEQQYLVELELA